MNTDKYNIFRTSNGLMARLPNRRILLKKSIHNDGSYAIEMHTIIKSRTWKTTKMKRLHNAKVVTAIRLSREAIIAITRMALILEDDEQQKNIN